jgi:GntR family transcriptional regulator, transcriptional repressor for pyruvate dehydrogenase complex
VARGELVPGDRFPSEDQLMEVFGVARTTLREALRILESEGLVEVLRGRRGGPRVTRPSVEHLAKGFALTLQLDGVTIGDVYQARLLVEPQLAGMLAKDRSPAALEALLAAIDRADAAAGDGIAFGEAATAVHEAIVENSGNSSLSLFAKLLHELVAQFYSRTGSQADPAERKRAVKSYRRFYELVDAGDADGAEAHWRRLMSYTARGAPDEPVDLFR